MALTMTFPMHGTVFYFVHEQHVSAHFLLGEPAGPQTKPAHTRSACGRWLFAWWTCWPADKASTYTKCMRPLTFCLVNLLAHRQSQHVIDRPQDRGVHREDPLDDLADLERCGPASIRNCTETVSGATQGTHLGEGKSTCGLLARSSTTLDRSILVNRVLLGSDFALHT